MDANKKSSVFFLAGFAMLLYIRERRNIRHAVSGCSAPSVFFAGSTDIMSDRFIEEWCLIDDVEGRWK